MVRCCAQAAKRSNPIRLTFSIGHKVLRRYTSKAHYKRAHHPSAVTVKETAPPTYSGPAPHLKKRVIELREPILDPYSVYQQGGLDLLHEELTALSAKHLRQIIRAYALADDAVLDSMSKAVLQ